MIFFFFSSRFVSDERLLFFGVSALVPVRNGEAIWTTGGGGDGVSTFADCSFSIDGGDGDMSTKSLGEWIGDRTRVFFSSLTGFVAVVVDGGGGIGFFFGMIFCLLTFVDGGFLLGFVGTDSFFVGTGAGEGDGGGGVCGTGADVVFSCWTEIDWVNDVVGW